MTPETLLAQADTDTQNRLPQPGFDPAHVTTMDMWGFSESQGVGRRHRRNCSPSSSSLIQNARFYSGLAAIFTAAASRWTSGGIRFGKFRAWPE